jgi:hypothetical protein
VPASAQPPSPSLAAIRDLASLVPTTVHGHHLRAQNVLAGVLGPSNSVPAGYDELLANVGHPAADLSIALAFDPTGESDLRVTAVRVHGVSGQHLLETWIPVVEANPVAHVNRRTIGDRPASCITSMGLSAVCYVARDDVLFAAMSGEFLLVREAVLAVP